MAHALLDDTTSILADLIAFPSISQDSNADLIDYLKDRLDPLCSTIEVTRDATGGKANIFATIGPADVDGGVVLSGHTDVVPVEGQDWTSDPFVATLRDGRIYGRGACDMKGFIACAMAYAPLIAQTQLSRPLHLAFTYDEEVGCLGAQLMLDRMKWTAPKPAICIVGEPTSMGIIEGHKGCCEYTTTFSGTAGHASQPELGVNAVEYAVHYVTRLLEIGEALRARAPAQSPFDPPWSTIQVGRMSGGVARNMIAEACSVDWELRPINSEDFAFAKGNIETYVETSLLPRMRAVHPDANILTSVIGEVMGLEPMTPSQAETLVRALTGNRDPATCASFGTEAGLFQQLGISTVICGPGSIAQAHKADEYVELQQLDDCLNMLGKLGETLVEAV